MRFMATVLILIGMLNGMALAEGDCPVQTREQLKNSSEIGLKHMYCDDVREFTDNLQHADWFPSQFTPDQLKSDPTAAAESRKYRKQAWQCMKESGKAWTELKGRSKDYLYKPYCGN
jgi:hypothetical protein